MSAFNGAGQFIISGVGLPYITGTTISSTVANQLNQDLAAGLSNCITRDGQSPPTSNIPMGNFKIIGMGPATGPGGAVNYDQWGAGQTPGTTTNDNAAAGMIGEYLSATNVPGTPMTNGVNTNVDSISLTPGDWDVRGTIVFSSIGGAANSLSAGLTTTSATLPSSFATGALLEVSAAFTPSLGNIFAFCTVRFSLAVTTTVYMVGQASFTTGTMIGYGFLGARRVR